MFGIFKNANEVQIDSMIRAYDTAMRMGEEMAALISDVKDKDIRQQLFTETFNNCGSFQIRWMESTYSNIMSDRVSPKSALVNGVTNKADEFSAKAHRGIARLQEYINAQA